MQQNTFAFNQKNSINEIDSSELYVEDFLRQQENSMILTHFIDMGKELSGNLFPLQNNQNTQYARFQEEKQLLQMKICVDSLCFQQFRQINTQQEEKIHKGHKICSMKSLLGDLDVLKCNSIFKSGNPDIVQGIMSFLDKIFNEFESFERQFLATLRELKVKVFKHITQSKQSFEAEHYQKVRKLVTSNFSYANVAYAIKEIQKFNKLKYDTLEYPHFKVNVLNQRIKEMNMDFKVPCLQNLKEWIKYFSGENSNYNKVYNRSASTFMFKSISQKRLFSYYLRSPQYQVFDQGQKISRTGFKSLLPVAVVQKRLQYQKILIKVNKIGKGVAIGCGILHKMEEKKFNNVNQVGFFLHSTGVLFSLKTQTKFIFKYTQGDTISLSRDQNRIYFHKIQGGRIINGFYVNLQPFQSDNNLNVNEKYYVAVFLQDQSGQLMVLP